MLFKEFPNLQWLKSKAENGFDRKGWPNVVLTVKSPKTLRDDIPGPLSFFSNVSGTTEVTVNNRTTVINEDYFFISNNTQRYTLEIPKAAETFNIHFAEGWEPGDFYNKLYRKDDTVKLFLGELQGDKTRLQREEILAKLLSYLAVIHRGEKLKLDNLDTAKVSTREEIIRRLHLATDHIYSNYQSDISLEDLSKISMLSKFHFLRAFQQAFGSSPHKFLNMVRLEKAKRLLTNPGLTITDISKAVGVTDPSSFSRMFRKETGVYPTVFRARA
ncbi:MAG TPA: AraC family transcriptional regulator [Cyclobacteriaceae bacterium]|nr:AraC family transcriptional regulator [Cyclobacteriaceae bacterium]